MGFFRFVRFGRLVEIKTVFVCIERAISTLPIFNAYKTWFLVFRVGAVAALGFRGRGVGTSSVSSLAL